MRILIAAVTAGILSSTALAAEPVPVQPEFHSLNAAAAAPKRRLPGSHKSAAVSAPVRFESRAVIDQQGELQLSCSELESADKADAHHEH